MSESKHTKSMTMSTITTEQQQAIADFLKDRYIPSGLGSKKEACSIAAINLTLTGKLTDDIPECMPPVIGRWIIRVQDSMPDEMRNSAAWRSLLPLAAGTGREHEAERVAIILDRMWNTVLPHIQPLADANGFGHEWRRMYTERTASAAKAAAKAAVRAAYVAHVATRATYAAAAAAAGIYEAAGAAAYAAAKAAAAAASVADAKATDESWRAFDPPALLAKLIDVGGVA